MQKKIKSHHDNVFIQIQTIPEYDKNIIFCDPPYLLGSELETHDYTHEIINKIQANELDSDLFQMIEHNNKLDIKGSGTDFMSKWDAPKGKDWETFFKHSFRILKHGGFLIMFGMEEAGSLFSYYASMAGFEMNQSIYYFYGSSFPKNVNLSKAVDSRLGKEREVVGYNKLNPNDKKLYTPNKQTSYVSDSDGKNNIGLDCKAISKSNSELGQKYEGYHAGKKPLKANTEIIYVFHKPTKTGTYIGDLMAYEEGDTTIHVSAFDIDGNRIEYEEGGSLASNYSLRDSISHSSNKTVFGLEKERITIPNKSGRYPSQLLFDPAMAQKLDDQSGELKSGSSKSSYIANESENITMSGKNYYRSMPDIQGSLGGASRFFSIIPYFDESREKFVWSSKVSKYERNAGTDKNNHPTLKNMNMIKKVLDFFKTPNRPNEKAYIPFAGTWSEVTAMIASGYKEENVECCELTNTEEEPFIDIGQARYKFWKDNDFFFILDDKKEFQQAKKKAEKPEKEEIDIFKVMKDGV